MRVPHPSVGRTSLTSHSSVRCSMGSDGVFEGEGAMGAMTIGQRVTAAEVDRRRGEGAAGGTHFITRTSFCTEYIWDER